jgi:hypothetical protein
MAAEGVSPFVIMQIVQHKDTKTAGRSMHHTDEHLMTAMVKLEKKFHQFSQHLQTDKKLDIFRKREKQANINS